MINEQNIFDQPVNLQQVNFSKKMIKQLVVYNHKLTAVDLSKQQALDADPKSMQEINFTVNLDRD